jgi:hypothetical protein
MLQKWGSLCPIELIRLPHWPKAKVPNIERWIYTFIFLVPLINTSIAMGQWPVDAGRPVQSLWILYRYTSDGLIVECGRRGIFNECLHRLLALITPFWFKLSFMKISFPSNDSCYGSFCANGTTFITIYSNCYEIIIFGRVFQVSGFHLIMFLGLNAV